MLSKLLSARFWVMMMVTFTYCLIVGQVTFVYLEKATAEKLEGFAMGLVIGFASFAAKALSEYFGINRALPGAPTQEVPRAGV